MSLLSTLAKVAVGVAVAKGVSSMAKGSGGGGLGDMLGGALGGGSQSGGAGSGSIFGGPQSPGGSTQSGMPDLGGLGQILAGKSGNSGGLGGLLEGLSQASRPDGEIPVTKPAGGSLGDLLNQSLDGFGEPTTLPEPKHEDHAKLLLRSMLQAAKSDGRIDADEKKALLDKLGDVSREDMAFINKELARPVDVRALARDVPRGMGSQVYTMSLLAIDLDQKGEAKYLHELADAVGVDPREANAIHDRLGEPRIYG